MNRLFFVVLCFFSAFLSAKPVISFNDFKWDTHVSDISKAHKAYRELGLELDYFKESFLMYDFSRLKNSNRAELLGNYPLESKTFYFKNKCKEDSKECLLTSGTYTLANPESIDLNELINKYKAIYTYVGVTTQSHYYSVDGVSGLHANKVRYIFVGNYGGTVLIELIIPEHSYDAILTDDVYVEGVPHTIDIRYLNRELGKPYIEEYKKLIKNTKSIQKVNKF